VQARKRQLDLGLHTAAAQHRHIRRQPGCVPQQRCLANAGFTLDNQHPAAAATSVVKQIGDDPPLRRAPA
jgi:hypothetical protein